MNQTAALLLICLSDNGNVDNGTYNFLVISIAASAIESHTVDCAVKVNATHAAEGDISMDIGIQDDTRFGFKWGSLHDSVGKVTLAVNLEDPNLNPELLLKGFDIDRRGEIIITLNDTFTLVLAASTNKKVCNHTLSLDAELLNDDNNVISFQAGQLFL